MAVLDEVPGIEVTIQVNGQNATEYVDPHASDTDRDANLGCPVVSKYIESIDDAEFSIKMAIDDDTYAWDDIEHVLSAEVNIDGKQVTSFLAERGGEGMMAEDQLIYSEESQQWYCRKMKFSAISIAEDRNAAQVQEDIETVKEVGLIQVSLERCVEEGRATPVPDPFINTNTLEVAEKVLKGKTISHSASLGNPMITEETDLYHSSRVAADNGPIAVFRFIYRSQESLKKELIIPRSPSPELVVPTTSVSIGNLTMAEVRRLAQERLDQINAAKSRHGSAMKRQANEVVDVDEEAEKAHSAKRPALTIDLTDD
ncbi:hypothetical protein F4824DRAFT_493903 [Ustulina deusta]|nr:hypothetical protein F4824DRAFT_493903 [Ustulina deusta]